MLSQASGSVSEAVGDRFPDLLAATTLGVYLLVVAGATTAITEAAVACPTWPACNGQWVVGLDDPLLLVAWGHRVVALVVGLAVLTVAVAAWVGPAARSVRPRVRWTLTALVALFPVQVAIGAVAATTDPGPAVSALHLGVGVTIFAGLVVALAWTLEPDHLGEPEDSRDGPADSTVDPAVDPTADSDPTPDPTASDPPTGATAAADPGTTDSDAGTTGSDAIRDDRDRDERGDRNDDGTLARVRTRARAYARLTKPRLMWLLCLVAAAAMALAGGAALDPRTVLATLVGGVLAIGASGTFNHVLERDVDRRMNRTADRPIVTDQVGVYRATAFGLALTVASLAVFAWVGPLVAALGLTAILFYSVVYTLLLKPNTVQNTVIGGAAGALPALIGWAAVEGSIGLPGLLLATVIFLWTPAHFYNLALAYKDDYERGGFPMLPVVRGEAVTRKHVLLYLGATLAGAAVLGATTSLGAVYAATTVALGGVFLWAVLRLHRERTTAAAFRSFHAANAYLGALLLAVVVDSLVI